MNILSIDPGVAKAGISIFKDDDLVACEFLTEQQPHPKEFHPRMNAHMQYLIPYFTTLLDTHHIDHVVWEIVPAFARFGSRDLVVAAADTLKVLTFQRHLSYTAITPNTWHKKFANDTKVTKAHVKKLVLQQFPNVKEDFTWDVYDSIAIGITAYQMNKWIAT